MPYDPMPAVTGCQRREGREKDGFFSKEKLGGGLCRVDV